jgi:hypothetical protein
MSIAATTDMGFMRQVSPELVLVDSLLAFRARALLPDPPDTFARVEQPARIDEAPHPSAQVTDPTPESEQTPTPEGVRNRPVRPSPFPFSFPDNGRYLGVREAEQRDPLVVAVVDETSQDEYSSGGKHLRRVATFIPASSSAIAVSLFVLQLYLSQGTLS